MSQATTIKDFTSAVKTTLQGLGIFAAHWKTPGLDIVRLLQEARFPAVLIADMGGLLDTNNHKIWKRRLAITVVVDNQRDNMGDYAHDTALDLSDQVIAALSMNTALGLSLLPRDDGVGALEDSGSIVLAFKTHYFEYEIQRA